MHGPASRPPPSLLPPQSQQQHHFIAIRRLALPRCPTTKALLLRFGILLVQQRLLSFALERYVQYIDPIPNTTISLATSGLLTTYTYRRGPVRTMPVSRGKQTPTPVIVEVRPSDARVSTTNLAPSSPPGSPSTKKARFANELVDGVTRPLNPTEAWSLWHFETHARQCRDCYDSLNPRSKGFRLCGEGNALAQDVAEHVYYQGGEIYSRTTDSNRNPVRVEIVPGYDQVRSLLQTTRTRSPRTVPVVNYDYPSRRHSSPSRQPEPRPEQPRRRYTDERAYVEIEPATTIPRRKSSHKPRRYGTVVVVDDVEKPQPEPSRQPERKPESRKGQLYDADVERRKRDKGYVVEVREPSSRDRERDRDRERERERERRRRDGGVRRTGYYYG